MLVQSQKTAGGWLHASQQNGLVSHFVLCAMVVDCGDFSAGNISAPSCFLCLQRLEVKIQMTNN